MLGKKVNSELNLPIPYILEVKSRKKKIPFQSHREYNFLFYSDYSSFLENAHKPDQTIQSNSVWELESVWIHGSLETSDFKDNL